jgi:predicted O-methyltransferase YrrM
LDPSTINSAGAPVWERPAFGKRLRQLYEEVWLSPYYRLHPIRTGQLAIAKIVLARNRIADPIEFLRRWGIDTASVSVGLRHWQPLFEETLHRIACRGGQQGSISLEDGIILYTLTRVIRPRHVIETGVAAGASTTFISAALVDNGAGNLYSIELPLNEVTCVRHLDGSKFDWPRYGVGWALPASLRSRIGNRHTLILEDARTALPVLLSRIREVDLFFHDDLHEPDHMLQQYRLVWNHLSSGGFLVSDDINYSWLQFRREKGFSRSVLDNIQRLGAIRKPADLRAQ